MEIGDESLPEPPRPLCFMKDELVEDGFTVDQFMSRCRGRATLETMRMDLGLYFNTIKSALIELINQDYADFVSLSGNLVGTDKAVENVRGPLQNLKSEFVKVQVALDEAVEAIQAKMSQRKAIGCKRRLLEQIVSVSESVTKIERLIKAQQDLGAETSSDHLIERIATEFNCLMFSVAQCSRHKFIETIQPRIARIERGLFDTLERMFNSNLASSDLHELKQCLRTYATINKRDVVERLFRTGVVKPFMEKAIRMTALSSHPRGLEGVYERALEFVSSRCASLLDLTCPSGGGHLGLPRGGGGSGHFSGDDFVHGYDFLVNAVWPELVASIEKELSTIFAPGDPDSFHRNYLVSMAFLASFESQCRSRESMERLREHDSYKKFINKWSLSVYYQIRFQEIGGYFEESLDDPFSKSNPGSEFHLAVTSRLWQCLQSCWSTEIFLQSLAHRFWKLTLQLLSRLTTWLHDLISGEIAIDSLVLLVIDIGLLEAELPSFFVAVAGPKLAFLGDRAQEFINGGCVVATYEALSARVPVISETIIDQLGNKCMQYLEPTQTIPRLYRHTNRETPAKASAFVGDTFRPLSMFGKFPESCKKEWTQKTVYVVTERYATMASDLLSSVKKTEESLLRLKRGRRSGAAAATTTSSTGMTDDNKIRLQIYLDVQEFKNQVVALGVSLDNLPPLTELLLLVEAARNTALSSSSSSSSSSLQ